MKEKNTIVIYNTELKLVVAFILLVSSFLYFQWIVFLTYHFWSSNSRWFVFASKRDDGLYGKPYFCYVDSSGEAHKPFVLPQQDPYYYDYTLKSFNIPELATGKLPFSTTGIEHLYWKENAEQF